MPLPNTIPSLLRPFVALLIVAVPALVVLTVMRRAGGYSWDDGAITLAFGRTLIDHGRLALTPVSPVVEGSSSLLYTVLTGLVQGAGGLGFDAAITASRGISALFASASALMLLHALVPALARGQALVFALIYALLPLNYVEIHNGMEMLAFGCLLLAWCVLMRAGRDGVALLMLPLLLLCRFEAAFYIGFALCGAWVFCANPDLRRRLCAQFLGLCGVFAVMSIGRYMVFGAFVPNTILAKMHPPYSYSGAAEIQRKLAGLWEYLSFYLLPLAFALYAVWRNPALRGRVEPWLLLAFGVFAGLSGKNWGYDGRMALAALPFTLLFLADAFGRQAGAGLPRMAARLIGVTLVVYCCAGIGAVSALAGSLRSGLAFERMRAEDLANTDPALPFAHGQYGVTPENYRITGLAVTALADLIDLEVIRFAVPDVGGLGLCCARIDVMDSALLTNPDLARNGYARFPEQLARLRPDVIETHEVWAEVARIYALPEFTAQYVPVVFENNLLHLRRDHLARLRARGMVRDVAPGVLDFDQIRYTTVTRDQDWLVAQPVIHLIGPHAQ